MSPSEHKPRGLVFGNYPQLYKPKQTTHNHHYQEAFFNHTTERFCALKICSQQGLKFIVFYAVRSSLTPWAEAFPTRKYFSAHSRSVALILRKIEVKMR